MRTRTLTGLSAALAAGGAISAVIGMHITHTAHPVIGGLAITLAATPAALTAHARYVTALTDQQRTAARLAGYRQGLADVAAGLLAPTSSTRMDNSDDHERTPE
jgi:predicted transcriptional regulator